MNICLNMYIPIFLSISHFVSSFSFSVIFCFCLFVFVCSFLFVRFCLFVCFFGIKFMFICFFVDNSLFGTFHPNILDKKVSSSLLFYLSFASPRCVKITVIVRVGVARPVPFNNTTHQPSTYQPSAKAITIMMGFLPIHPQLSTLSALNP